METTETPMAPLLKRLRQYAVEHKFSQKEMAARLGVPYPTVKHWLGPKPYKKLSASYAQLVQAFLNRIATPQAEPPKDSPALAVREKQSSFVLTETKGLRRARRVKLLLLLLEDELQWFRDNTEDIRMAYRAELDPYDIGYISSLLSMLTDEEKFQRWKALTSNRFGYFRRRPKGDGTARPDSPKRQ